MEHLYIPAGCNVVIHWGQSLSTCQSTQCIALLCSRGLVGAHWLGEWTLTPPGGHRGRWQPKEVEIYWKPTHTDQYQLYDSTATHIGVVRSVLHGVEHLPTSMEEEERQASEDRQDVLSGPSTRRYPVPADDRNTSSFLTGLVCQRGLEGSLGNTTHLFTSNPPTY